MRSIQLVVKVVLDRLVALLLLAVLSPVLAVIGVAVRTVDGRPVFFRQERVGRNQKLFRIWKFRSMVVDADAHLDEKGRPTTSRVSKTGKFLRQTSLDELPNLINIAVGDMSLVGPRPVLPEQAARYTEIQRSRFQVRPGITGLAQVMGRNELPWSRRLELDAEYVQRFSLRLDLAILWRTVFVVIRREGISLDRNVDAADDLAPTDLEVSATQISATKEASNG